MRLRLAAWLQIVGAAFVLLLAVSAADEVLLALLPPALSSLVVGLFLLKQPSKRVAQLSVACSILWPLAPLLALHMLTSSLHGGEMLLMLWVPIGAIFAIVVDVMLLPTLRSRLKGAIRPTLAENGET